MRLSVITIVAVYLATAHPLTANEPHDAPRLLDTIALWLSVNFDLPLPQNSPDLISVPPADLVVMRYGLENTARSGDDVAVYDKGTIFLSQAWKGQSPAELSILVHEMVHHLQASADMRFACPGEREVLAYRAQDAWLDLFGESLESAFGIDKGTILVGTACVH